MVLGGDLYARLRVQFGVAVVIARRNGEQQYSETEEHFVGLIFFLVAFWLFFS